MGERERGRVLMGVLVGLLLGVLAALPAGAEGGEAWPQIEARQVVGGLANPVQVTHAGDGSGRLFIVEKGGRIRIFQAGALRQTPFLDLSGLVSTSNEQGLLGLAFSPDFARDGDFYVNYTDRSGNTQIVRYHLSADPNVADPASAERVLAVTQDFANHNGGQLLFGPDGMLYIGMGDGGGGGDPNNRAQSPGSLLGKMLRIDVESGDPATYTIPPDNPFVGSPETRDEIWALGLRNPWRFSFDRATGDLWSGDVGQGQWEEINRQPAASSGGENYGWRCYEGTHPYNNSDCAPFSSYTPPVHEYPHNAGTVFHCSVTGGFVYRGASYPRMVGIYFYADYCSGHLWGLRPAGTGWENQLLLDTPENPVAFGEDQAGNLYLVDIGSDAIYELVDATPTALTLATTTSPAAPLPLAALAGMMLVGTGAVLAVQRQRRAKDG